MTKSDDYLKDPHVQWSEGSTEDLKTLYYALLEVGLIPDRVAVQVTCTDEEHSRFIKAILKRKNVHHVDVAAFDDTTSTIDIHCRKGLWEMIL